jgi:hypothetical protein
MTELKRVVVYFTEEEKKELEFISGALSQSMSSLVGEMVRETMPQLKAVAQAITLAKTNPDDAVKMIRSLGYDAHSNLIEEMKKLDK